MSTSGCLSEPAPDLDARFDPRTGDTGDWLGADCAASLPLGDGRVLWLFNDTFWRTGGSGIPTDRIGADFEHDSIAVQHGTDLATSAVTFHRRPGGGAWFPVSDTHHAWPEGGIVLDGDLYVTSKRVLTADPLGPDAGWCVHRVPRVLETPVESWEPHLLYESGDTDTRPVLSLYEDDGHVYAFGLKLRHGWRQARWSRADFVAGDLGAVTWNTTTEWSTDPASAFQFADSYMAAEGSVHRRPDGRWVIVESGGGEFPRLLVQARVADGPEFRPANHYHPIPPLLQVGDAVDDLESGFSGMVTEVTGTARTVQLDPIWGGSVHPGRTAEQLRPRTATQRGIYTPPQNAVADSQNYAGKAHPHLSSDEGGGLVCSYVDARPWLGADLAPVPGGLAHDLSTYWPKFFRVRAPRSSGLTVSGGTATWQLEGAPDRLLIRAGDGPWTELDPTAGSAPVSGSPVLLRAIGLGGQTEVTA